MNYANLDDLLTVAEKSSQMFKFHFQGHEKMFIKFLNVEQLGNLFSVIEWPFQRVPNNTTLGAMVLNELTERAIKKNLPIF